MKKRKTDTSVSHRDCKISDFLITGVSIKNKINTGLLVNPANDIYVIEGDIIKVRPVNVLNI